MWMGGPRVKVLLKIQGNFLGGFLANDYCDRCLYILFLTLKFAQVA